MRSAAPARNSASAFQISVFDNLLIAALAADKRLGRSLRIIICPR